MDQQTLTPPPSFRALRVHTRVRTRTIADENKCVHGQRPPTAPSLLPSSQSSRPRSLRRKDISSSPSRGRTRSRVPRPGLTLNTNCGTQLQNATSNFAMAAHPACCSPPPGGDPRSAGTSDDDLIFQMSPVLACSPPAALFALDPVGTSSPYRYHGGCSRVKESTSQALAALWDKHHLTSTQVAQTQSHNRRKRTRTDTITQHRRGVSDSFTPAKRDRIRDGHHHHRQQKYSTPQPGAKPLLDLSPLLHTTPSSPIGMSSASSPVDCAGNRAEPEPFMYTFPNFESSPLAKARLARHRHSAGRAAARGDLAHAHANPGLTHSADSSLDSSLVGEAEAEGEGASFARPRLGPIRARKLQIQSEESLCGDLDDANFISRAFRSASLDPEKESELGEDGGEEEEDGDRRSEEGNSFFSQPTSVSSFSVDGDDVDDDDGGDLAMDQGQCQTSVISDSLLASILMQYPSRDSVAMEDVSGYCDLAERAERQEDQQATLRGRGRSMRRLSAEHHHEHHHHHHHHQQETSSRGRRRLPLLYAQAYDASSIAASLASL